MTETAAPKGNESYTWYEYRAPRGVNLTTTSGKRSVMLRKGSVYGLRPATKKNEFRLVTQELGPTIVFTLSEADNKRMQQRGSPVRRVRDAPQSRSNPRSTVPQRTRVREETPANARRRNETERLADVLGKLTVKQARDYLTWLAEKNAAPSLASHRAWSANASR